LRGNGLVEAGACRKVDDLEDAVDGWGLSPNQV
jgi:hypothetical protein